MLISHALYEMYALSHMEVMPLYVLWYLLYVHYSPSHIGHFFLQKSAINSYKIYELSASHLFSKWYISVPIFTSFFSKIYSEKNFSVALLISSTAFFRSDLEKYSIPYLFLWFLALDSALSTPISSRSSTSCLWQKIQSWY